MTTKERELLILERSVVRYIKRPKLQFEFFPETDSTNRIIKELGEKGKPEGIIAVAERQTQGRGRKGRSFYSPTGGLYMSILLRPKIKAQDALLITTAAAVAVTNAIKKVFDKQGAIKWVNDIYLDGRKVCGILTEASMNFESGGLYYACLGIGINLSDPKEGFPEDIKDTAASLTGKEECPKEKKIRLIAEICNEFFDIYDMLPDKSFMDEYKKRSFLIGKNVNVLKPDSQKSALVIDIDNDAHLIVEYENGEKEALHSGDVSVKGI